MGQIKILDMKINKNSTFTGFIRGGLQFHFRIAIDFSGLRFSNAGYDGNMQLVIFIIPIIYPAGFSSSCFLVSLLRVLSTILVKVELWFTTFELRTISPKKLPHHTNQHTKISPLSDYSAL